MTCWSRLFSNVIILLVQSDNVSLTDDLPTVSYLLGLDRRGTYVVRESVEKVLLNVSGKIRISF